MKPKILLVDDEPNIIHSYSRGLRKEWDLVTALSGEEGLTAIREQGPFPVIVSDFNMPCMNGITFLARTIESSPESVRVMLTGEGDFQIATQAVNEGNIFRFITKPCPLDRLQKILSDSLRQYNLQQLEKESHRQELAIAGKIQQTLLIERIPAGLKLNVAAVTVPSNEADGDFIDFFRFDENRLDVVIADVMGKGLHAAMVGAGAKNRLSRVLWQLSMQKEPRALEPVSVMEEFKLAMDKGLEEVQCFITMIYASFDLQAGVMTFIDAGHMPVLHYTKGENVWREVKGSGGPVGLAFKKPYEQKDIHFSSGDLFLFYSDGLWEGRNSEKQTFGSVAMKKCAEKLVNATAEDFVAGMLADYRSFVVPGPFFDDLTLIVVRIP